MKEYMPLLKRSRLFQGIQEEEIAAMLRCLSASTRSYQKGDCVFRRGEQISSVAMLLEGCVHIQKEDYWGNLSILVLLLDVKRVLTMCSSACRFHGRLIHNLLTVIAGKNLLLTRKLEHMSCRTTRKKLLSYLSEQSLKAGRPDFDIPFNRQQLADFLSVDRSAMSNELCKMRDEGILTFDRNHFVLN